MSVTAREGRLTLFIGPMFAGKSRGMLLRLAKLQAEGKRTLLLKPEMDTRYGVDRVVAHSGEWLPAIPVSAWPEIPADVQVVAVDEAQFFCPPFFFGHFPSIVAGLLGDGVDVLVAALVEDWRGEPFEVTQALVALADEIMFLTANCSLCGARARRTAKIAGTSARAEIGGAAMYEPRCDAHWHSEVGLPAEDRVDDWGFGGVRFPLFEDAPHDVVRGAY